MMIKKLHGLSVSLSTAQALLISTLLTAGVVAFCALFLPVIYETNDDTIILSYLAGYRTGTPTPYGLYVSFGFGFAVSRLYMLLPQLPWHTIAHFVILWVSAAMVCFCILEKRINMMLSVIFIGCFLAGIFLFSAVLLQFTTTAAAAAGAAIVMLLHYERRGRRYAVFYTAMTALLLCFSYSLRPQVFYLGASLFLCAAAVRYFCEKEQRKNIAVLAVVSMASVLLLYGINHLAYSVPEYKEHAVYDRAMTRFIDYPKPSYSEAPEVYSGAGLSETEAALMTDYFFIFDKANAGTLQKLNGNIRKYYEDNPIGIDISARAMLTGAVITGRELRPHEADMSFYYVCIILVSAAIVVLSGLLSPGGLKLPAAGMKKYGGMLIALGTAAFFFLAALYFVSTHRFPWRVFRSLVLISALPLMYMSAGSVSGWTDAFKAASKPFSLYLRGAVMGAALLCLLLCYAQAFRSISFFSLSESRRNYASEMHIPYDYAISRPESVFLADDFNLRFDAYTVYPGKKPVNFIQLAGWELHSPMYYEQLRVNGFDIRGAFTLEDFLLDERVLFITNGLNDIFLAHIGEQYPGYELLFADKLPDGTEVYKMALLSR